jgi:hypothetical protein
LIIPEFSQRGGGRLFENIKNETPKRAKRQAPSAIEKKVKKKLKKKKKGDPLLKT